MGSNRQYQGALAPKDSTTEKIETSHISVMLQYDGSIFISSQSQKFHLKFVKQVSGVMRKVWIWGIQGSGNCPTGETFAVVVV